jgi:hypothetical protein
MSRPAITGAELDDIIREVQRMLYKRIEQHGDGAFSSSHEILGILNEEMHEYLLEVCANDREGQVRELIDVAVGAIFGAASVKSGKAEW